MRRDTTPEISLETKVPSTKKLTRKDIMLTQLKMMNRKGKELEKKELILQVMKNVP